MKALKSWFGFDRGEDFTWPGRRYDTYMYMLVATGLETIWIKLLRWCLGAVPVHLMHVVVDLVPYLECKMEFKYAHVWGLSKFCEVMWL